MRPRGCAEPDASIYSALVTGLARAGDSRRAAAVATEACEAAIKRRVVSGKLLSSDCLTALFAALRKDFVGDVPIDWRLIDPGSIPDQP